MSTASGMIDPTAPTLECTHPHGPIHESILALYAIERRNHDLEARLAHAERVNADLALENQVLRNWNAYYFSLVYGNPNVDPPALLPATAQRYQMRETGANSL